MDFSAVVEMARQLLSAREQPGGGGTGVSGDPKGGQIATLPTRKVGDAIYGRVCTTRGGEPPVTLSSDLKRKSVFLFGPDAVESIIVRQSGYGILCSIGRDKNYLYHTVSNHR